MSQHGPIPCRAARTIAIDDRRPGGFASNRGPLEMQRRGFLKTMGGLAGCLLCAGTRSFAAEEHHWSYAGATGPDHWGDGDPQALACRAGTEQSPIDIRTTTRASLPRLNLAWKPVAGDVVNNGHTIEVTTPGAGGMDVGGMHYDLVQVHFHAPSEHRIDGRAFPMEAHFVHRHGPSGALGVLGVFLAEGRPNLAFAQVMAAMPERSGGRAPLPAPLALEGLVPASRRYWSYEGSLTTPPCSEIVDWRVCVDPVEVAAADIARFTALYPMNARPIQQANRRFVLVSE